MASNIITSDGKDLDDRYMPKGTSIPPRAEAYITKVWHSGDRTSWYRKWSDGWIEQGGLIGGRVGEISFTFPIPFSSTNYVRTYANYVYSSYGVLWHNIGKAKSNTGFTFQGAGQEVTYDFYACGY